MTDYLTSAYNKKEELLPIDKVNQNNRSNITSETERSKYIKDTLNTIIKKQIKQNTQSSLTSDEHLIEIVNKIK